MSYVKAEWRASVTNGKIPRELLAEIVPRQFDPDLSGPAVLHPEAAKAMGSLLRHASDDGVDQLRVKYSYRTLTVQWVKWNDYQAGGNLAAYPGTSNHGWAVAVDFTGLDAEALNWLETNARRYGFINDVPSENWHYTYQEGLWNGVRYVGVDEDIIAGSQAGREATLGANPPAGKSAIWKWAFNESMRIRVAATKPVPGAVGAHEHDVSGKAK